MEDIAALTRFTPQEQAEFEKEQNIFGIVKTMEFLVRNKVTHQIDNTCSK